MRTNHWVDHDVRIHLITFSLKKDNRASSYSNPLLLRHNRIYIQQYVMASSSSDSPNHEELIALLKAIKFAHPAYDLKKVVREVQSKGRPWTTVSTKVIRKELKKLGLLGFQTDEDMLRLRITTIGGESKSSRATEEPPEPIMEDREMWRSVALDVPMTSMSDKPHQGIVSFNDSEVGLSTGQGGEIYKIQAAEHTQVHHYPLMVYNKARTRKTFFHSHVSGYEEICQHVLEEGKTGSLADSSGRKAYFWGHYSAHHDRLFLNVRSLAPPQEW